MANEILIDIGDFVDNGNLTEDQKDAITEMYNSIYSELINPSNIFGYVVLLMKIANTYKIIENVDKKQLVIFVLQKYVQLNVTNHDEVLILDTFIQNILPTAIDTLISVEKNEILINKEIKMKASSCCCIS